MLTQDEAFTDAMTYLAGALPGPNNGSYRDFLGAVTAAKQHGWSESETATWAERTARGKAEFTWQTLKPANGNGSPVRTAIGIARKYGYTLPLSGNECAACGNRSHHLTDGRCYRCAPPPVQTDRVCLGCGQIDVPLRSSLCQDCHTRIASPPPPPPVAEPDITCIDCEVPIPAARLVDGRCKLCIHMANQPPVAEPDIACVECEDPVPSGQLVAGRCKLCIHLANLTAPEPEPEPEPAPPAPQFTGCEFCLHSLFPSEVAIWRLAHKDDSERRHCYYCRHKCPACAATPIPRGMATPPPKDVTAGRPQQMDKKGYGVHAGRRQLNGG